MLKPKQVKSRQTWVLFFFWSFLLWLPTPSLEAQTFPYLRPGQSLSSHEILSFLNTKYAVRHLFQNGPIEQPERFWLIIPGPDEFQHWDTGGRELWNSNAYQLLDFSEHPHLNFQQAATAIVQSQLPLPLVFKMNNGSMGEQVLFIESTEEGTLLLSMSVAKDSEFSGGLPDKARLANQLGISDRDVSLSSEQNTLQVQVRSGPQQDRIRILQAFMQRHAMPIRDRIELGVLETKITPLLLHGRAFETRHRFRAQLDSAELHRMSGFARLGSSSYFSNNSRRDGSEKLPTEQAFQDLFDEIGLHTPDAKALFEEHLEDLLRSHWLQLVRQLKANGLYLPVQVEVEVDLMWQFTGAGDFPSAFLIEMSFQEIGPSQEITVQGFSKTASCAVEARAAATSLRK